jgi:hypothetical protein
VDAALDIYQTLILDLDTEGRYLFLNAVANQLRYPNNHTHYFSFVLLYLFAESNQVKCGFCLVFAAANVSSILSSHIYLVSEKYTSKSLNLVV